MSSAEHTEQVPIDLLQETLDFVHQRAVQNHKLHQDWNEGSAAEFKVCTRGDCTEARELLKKWSYPL